MLITLDNVGKSYGIDVIVQGISAVVNENDRIGIIGENGAGKTTLLNMLMGILENDEGEIIVATDEGKCKKVIASLVERSKRYRKGSIIVSMREGASVICAAHVTAPYMLAIVDKNGGIAEISSESISILPQSMKAKKLSKYAEGSIERVIPLPYKKDE